MIKVEANKEYTKIEAEGSTLDILTDIIKVVTRILNRLAEGNQNYFNHLKNVLIKTLMDITYENAKGDTK